MLCSSITQLLLQISFYQRQPLYVIQQRYSITTSDISLPKSSPICYTAVLLNYYFRYISLPKSSTICYTAGLLNYYFRYQSTYVSYYMLYSSITQLLLQISFYLRQPLYVIQQRYSITTSDISLPKSATICYTAALLNYYFRYQST